jgi:hypothetical protein
VTPLLTYIHPAMSLSKLFDVKHQVLRRFIADYPTDGALIPEPDPPAHVLRGIPQQQMERADPRYLCASSSMVFFAYCLFSFVSVIPGRPKCSSLQLQRRAGSRTILSSSMSTHRLNGHGQQSCLYSTKRTTLLLSPSRRCAHTCRPERTRN